MSPTVLGASLGLTWLSAGAFGSSGGGGSDYNVLLEDNFNALLETGDFILLESAP
jgi:hypothetical protein